LIGQDAREGRVPHPSFFCLGGMILELHAQKQFNDRDLPFILKTANEWGTGRVWLAATTHVRYVTDRSPRDTLVCAR
jgi:hypothetical protein